MEKAGNAGMSGKSEVEKWKDVVERQNNIFIARSTNTRPSSPLMTLTHVK